jgi:hypothetical protein
MKVNWSQDQADQLRIIIRGEVRKSKLLGIAGLAEDGCVHSTNVRKEFRSKGAK